MKFTTLFPIFFAVVYLAYVIIASQRSKKTGESYEYRPFWLLASVAIIGLCIYAFFTGKDITQFIH